MKEGVTARAGGTPMTAKAAFGIRAKVTRRVTKATSVMATTSNVTDRVETTLKDKKDPYITGRRGRIKSKDMVASIEAYLERMERVVANIGMQLEDEIPSSATLEAAVEDLRGKALGALNSMADTLRQEFQRKLDQVFAELASFHDEMKEMKGN
ncbi:hypothetical protein F0562_025599 [Nyssa sinensis]|uniref:Uncharacterized protein n=1 Tax=Nyssa sinensis TaxID=561372 RepID=A0A5J5BAW9_9ASTE|nr:hypothetical protein F0562_025599 [Nyssa sinensis]